MSAEALLTRLDAVHQTSNRQWTARCPAHDDSKPSLSIREADGGTVLLHDFGGCTVAEIVRALGIELTELFPPRLPEGKHIVRPRRPRLSLADVAEVVTHELALIIVVIGDMRTRGTTMTEEENSRFGTAVNRLQAILAEARSL